MATFETRITPSGKKRFRAVIRRVGFKPKRATFDAMKKARDWAAKTEAEIVDGKYGLTDIAAQHTAGEMIDEYLRRVMPHKSKKKRYKKQQTQQLLWWKARIGKYALSNLSKAILTECRDDLASAFAPATVNCYLAALSHVFNIAIREWEWLQVSPMAGIRKMKENNARVRYLYENERPSLLDACKRERRKPLYLIALLAIAAGGRKEEILSLRIKNVDIERGAATIEETKNSKSKTFFITGLALEELRQYLAHYRHPRSEYVFPNRRGNRPMTIDREFRRCRERAGIDNFTFHDLRHTHASYLAMNGANPKDVAESLNQTTIKMAERYSHLSKTHVAGLVAAMNEKVFGKTTT